MSLFHDDPFDVISEGAPAEQESGEEAQSAGEAHNQEAQEEDAPQDNQDVPQDEQDATNEVPGDDEEATLADIAAESDIERPRKRSRPHSPVDGEEQRDADEQEANGAVQLPEETEPAVAVVGPSEVFVEQQRQLSLSELVAKSTQLELQLQASRTQQETLQQLLSNTKDQLERRVAELGAEASAVAKSGDEILKSVTAQHTSSFESMMAAATEARLSLSAAERGFREQKYWQHRSEFLEDALSWQQRSAGLWRDAFECAQKKTSHHTDATKLMSSTHQDVELLRSALAPSNAIVQSIASAQGWLDSLATTGDDEGAATIRLPLEKRALLHKLLQMTAEHVSDIATDHDALAAALGKSYQQVDQLKRTLSVSGLADLEPRIALLREMVDRQYSGTYVAPEETELRLKLKSLQDRNSLLEAVVASHIAKIDLIPNATSVVPHVLKDRIARCEVLEKEITDLRGEVAYLQRLRGTEGNVDLPLQQAGDGSQSQRTGKDTLLEVCAQQWLERARSATQLLLASCDPSEDRRSLALTTLQLQHALAAGQHQSVMLEHLRNTNALLHSKLASCQHLCEVLFAVPAVTTATGKDTSEWISCVEQAMAQMRECIANVGASHTIDDLTTACAAINATMEATLTKHGASVQASLIEGQDRYRKAMGFLITTLNHADAALCASAGVEHRPIAEVPLDAFDMQPAVLTVRSVVAPAAANTADVKRVLAAQVDANKATIASLTASLRSQISFHEKRWEWVVSQEGNHAVKELALAQDAVRSTTSLLAASNERCEEALKGAANAAQLQKRLSEKEERVTSLESQFKISQDALSKSRQELATLNKERTAASASADAAIAVLNRTVEKLEAELVEARQALIAAQEENNNAWANEDDAPAVEADNEEFQEVDQVVEATGEDELAGTVDNTTVEAEDLQTTQENGYDENEVNHNDDGDGDAALDDDEVEPNNDVAEEEDDTQLESEAAVQPKDDAEASGVTSTDE